MKNQDNLVPQLVCSAGFPHDHVRCLVILWCQRHSYDAYSEPQGYGRYKPDLVLRSRTRHNSKAQIVFVEIQKQRTKEWLTRTMENYKGKQLLIIDPDRYPVTDPTIRSYHEISKQLDTETDNMLLGNRKIEHPKQACIYCEKKFSIHSIYPHQRKCVKNPANKKTEEEE